jgi:hypothetical protein
LIRYGLSCAINVNDCIPWKNRDHKDKEDDGSNNYPFTGLPTGKALSNARLSIYLRLSRGHFNPHTNLWTEQTTHLQFFAWFPAKTNGQRVNH